MTSQPINQLENFAMKIEKITIQNFRAYRKLTTISCEALNLFVGKNDAGKSSILEALDIFFHDGKEVIKLDVNDRSINASESEDIMISVAFSGFPEEVDLDAGNQTTLKDEYLLNTDGHLEIRKKYSGRTLRTKTFVFANHPTNPECKDLLLQKQRDLQTTVNNHGYDCEDKRKNAELRKSIWNANIENLQLAETEINVDKEDAKTIWDNLQAYMPIYTLFQSDRQNKDSDNEVQNPMKLAVKEALRDQNLQSSLDIVEKKVRNVAEQIAGHTLSKLKEMEPDLANQLKPSLPTTLKWADVFRGIGIVGNDDIPLNKKGSGVKRLVLLSFFRAEAERKQQGAGSTDVIYAIEEPETSQHPGFQKNLAQALLDLSKSDRSQVFLTTHSPEVVKLLVNHDTKFWIVKKEAKTASLSNNDTPYAPEREISANEVNHLAFGIYTEEFHTELYAYMEERHQDIFKEKINKELDSPTSGYLQYVQPGKKTKYVTLSKYIRHQIHHPENQENRRYNSDDLELSIKNMMDLILSAKASTQQSP